MNVSGGLGMSQSSPTQKRKRDENSLPSSSAGPLPVSSVFMDRLRQLNDYVHEIVNSSGRPSIEIVFFHGIQLEGSEEVYINTWLSRDGSQLWLKWIVDAYPEARIVIISYDASVNLTDDQGRTNMYITRENLLQNMTTESASIGQDGCPVILVGHCMGGLVLKEVCLQASSIVSLDSSSHKAAQNLLNNIKGLFFYGYPHHGSQLAERSTSVSKGLLFQDLTTLNPEASRRKEEFRTLRKKFGWKAYGIGESLPVSMQGFSGLVVAEASARHDVDSFYTSEDSHHFNVCRPASKKSSSFLRLSAFVADVLIEDKGLRDGYKVELSAEVVGLDDKVKEILAMHKDTRRLGIVGMGGIGKTTLAKSIFNTISGSYEYTCFLPEVKKKIMADEESPDELRKWIIGRLFHQGRKVHSPFHWDTLKGKTVLIVLDDAESESQVLGISDSDGFSKKSLVIVTARDREFLNSEKFKCHFAEKLGNMDSRKIFCLHAFHQWNAPAGYEGQVARFTQKCDGLPLALKVVGKYLYKCDKSLWDDAFVKLSRAQSLDGAAKDPLFSILRDCVDSLAEADREMFLDVAVCFHGEELAAVKRAWSVCYSAYSGWETLVDRGLVTTETPGRRRTVIQMHEALRDLGRRIAYQDSQNIAGHSRLLRLSESKLLFDEGISKAKVLTIRNGANSVMDVSLLGELDEIRTLWVDMGYHGRLHGLFHKLPSRLLYLRVTGGQDWIEVSEETSPSCEDLQLRTTLRQCEIVDWRSLKTLSRSLGQLSALTHLRIENCHDLHTLPESLGSLQALEELTIVECVNCKTLPDTIGQLRNLRCLEILGCSSLETLPNSLGQLQALEELKIEECRSLTTLPDTTGQLRNLRRLEILGCSSLETRPNSLGQLQALEELKIDECPSLTTLPDTTGRLRNLRRLEILGCSSLETLPNSLGELPALEELKIEECRSLTTLPDTTGQLRNLRRLEIWGCNSLKTLPSTLGQLQALEELKIEECRSLTTLPDTTGQLRNLRRLEIWGCSSLETLGQHNHLGHGKQRDFVRDFIREINRGENGFFVSKAWLFSLEEREKETLLSVLGRTGYFEFYQTRTTIIYRRIENNGEVPTVYNYLLRTPGTNDVLIGGTKQLLASGDSVEIEEKGYSTKTQDGKELGSGSQTERSNIVDAEMSTVSSFIKKIQLAMVQTNDTSRLGSQRSLPDKGKTIFFGPNEKLESFKTALKDTGKYSYSVSTQWLSTLSDHEIEDVNIVLFKAGYSQIDKTSTTTYFKRPHDHVHNNPGHQSETSNTSERRTLVGDMEKSSTFQGTEAFRAQKRLQDPDDTQVTNKIQPRQRRKVDCGCVPKDMTVSCTPSSQGPVEPSTSSFPRCFSRHSTREPVGNCHVTMPRNRKQQVLNTGADKTEVMGTVEFDADDKPYVKPVAFDVSADTSLGCCLMSDRNNGKVRFEFLKIQGAVKIEDSVSLNTNALVLRAVRANVVAYIINAEEGISEVIHLRILNDKECAWPIKLDPHQSIDEIGQPRKVSWMGISPRDPINNECGSKNLELWCRDKFWTDPEPESCNHELMFSDHDWRVIVEGDVRTHVNQKSFLELNLRYQLEYSLDEAVDPLPQDPYVGVPRVTKKVDFGCVLEFRTFDSAGSSAFTLS